MLRHCRLIFLLRSNCNLTTRTTQITSWKAVRYFTSRELHGTIPVSLIRKRSQNLPSASGLRWLIDASSRLTCRRYIRPLSASFGAHMLSRKHLGKKIKEETVPLLFRRRRRHQMPKLTSSHERKPTTDVSVSGRYASALIKWLSDDGSHVSDSLYLSYAE